jgi:hypothetical protein
MDEVLRAIDYDAIDIHIHDGVVTLRGFASTLMIKKRAERAAHAVPGVLEVDNRIMTDEEITLAVSRALGRDERTRHLRILVSARHGVVTLNGELDSAEERSVVEDVAASVPQVRGVVNYIRAPGVIVEADEQRVLQPRVRQDVYAEDMFLGHVERVILSPQNRLVTAIVVRGEFPDLERAKPGMLPYEVPREERQVLLPIGSVRFVTISGVLLTLEAMDAARYPDFEPGNFLAPAPDWQPPYPYEHSDILLDSDRTITERVLESHTVSRKEE